MDGASRTAVAGTTAPLSRLPREALGPAGPRALSALDARLALAGIVALAAGLRFALLGQHSVWLDEAFVVSVATHPWREIPGLLRLSDQHPPLAYLLAHAWIGVAGTGEAAIRVPSAVLSVCAVFLTHRLARRVFAERVALLSALLVALSPFHIMAAQEARMYPLLGVLSLASTLFLADAAHGGRRAWAGYLLSSGLLVYVHYFGALVLLAHGLWIVCYERRQAVPWMACLAGVAVLLAPWAPAAFEQARHAHTFSWYHNPSIFMNLGDLLGLWAFGGSLLGMATYFFAGTRGAAEQFLVLLPFLVILWCGAAAAADRRAVALVGLPLLIAVGVPLCVSLLHPVFIPRWFSFLLPFFAIIMARGADEVAARFTFDRNRVVAAIAGVILLYQLPVLDRYYLDPGSRPFRWRDAARLVHTLAGPGDVIAFAGTPAAIAFAYYFRDPFPSLDLSSGDRLPLVPSSGPAAASRPRVWLIATIPFTAATRDGLLAGAGRGYHAAGARDFGGAIVYLLTPSP